MPTADHEDERRAGWDAQRRTAALVAAIVAFAVPVWFFATLIVVGTYRDNYVPGADAPGRRFVRFYADNFDKIPLTSTMFVIGWILILVVLVSVVRALAPGGSLPGSLAFVLAGAWIAVSVAGQGIFTWPTVVSEVTADDVTKILDPGVARFTLLSTAALQGAGGVLLGVALVMVALVAARSDLAGHWGIAALAAFMGVVGTLNLLLGGGNEGPVMGMILFGIVVSIVLLVARRRIQSDAARP